MVPTPSVSAASSARLIDGRAVAAEIAVQLAEETSRFRTATDTIPGLAVVLVGSDPASQVYVGAKGRKAEEIGALIGVIARRGA